MENKMMAMRTALRDISRVAEEMTRNTMSGKPEDRRTVDGWALRICDIIGSALDVPLRNCDVGTPSEQAQRIDAFCKSHGTDKNGYYRCEECPLLKIDRCELTWAQMPYEANTKGETDGSK